MSAFTMRRPLVKTGLQVRPLGIGGGGSISDDDSSSGEIFLKWKHETPRSAVEVSSGVCVAICGRSLRSTSC